MTMLERLYDAPVSDETPVVPIPEPAMRAVEESEDYGKFVIEPLPTGRAQTLGNSLRRTLLGAIGGAAVTWVRIAGAPHEYAQLPGMREDVMDFLLNLKGLRVRPLSGRAGMLRIEVDGQGEVCAGDVLATSDFEIVNPGHHLATLDSPEARLSVEMMVETGTGYRPGAENIESLPAGTLPVDAVFSPVGKANYTVENVRVGTGVNMERLVIEVWTDSAISPVDALKAAADTVMQDLYLVTVTKNPDQQQPQPGGHLPLNLRNMRIE